MKKIRRLFALAALGNTALMNSDSISDSAKVGTAAATSGGVVGTASTLSVLEKIADGQSKGVNINKYTKEGAANLAQGDSVMGVIKSQIGSGLKSSANDVMEVPNQMGSNIMSGGGAAGGTILAKKAGLGGTGQMIGSMAGSMVPSLFSEKGNNMIDSIMDKRFTVGEDLEDGVKSVGNAAGGIVGGAVGTLGGAALGAGVGAMAGGAWKNHQVKSALEEANQIAGKFQLGGYQTPEAMQQAQIRFNELTGKPVATTTNPIPSTPTSPNKVHSNLNKSTVNAVKNTAKARNTFGRGKGALVGMGVGAVLGGMQGNEKGSSLFSQVEESNDSIMQKEFGAGREAINFAKTTGKYLWEKRLPIAKQVVLWGGAGMAGTYAADKLITHDAKKIGLMPSNNNQQNQKQFAIVNGSVLKNIGKKAWKYTGGLIKEHPGEAIMSAGFMGGMSAIPYLSQRGQYMANKKAIAQQQQKEFGIIGGVLRKGGNFAWNGLKWAGNAIKGFVYDPKRGKQISKDFQRIGKQNNSQWAQKAGNWVENHKAVAGVGGAAATLASFEFMRPGEKITKSILNKADKNAFEYEKQQNQEVQ